MCELSNNVCEDDPDLIFVHNEDVDWDDEAWVAVYWHPILKRTCTFLHLC